MQEIKLIEITWNPSDNAIDFSVPSSADALIVEKDEEIIRKLLHLAKCLEMRQYPFSRLEGDGERTS